MTELLTPEEVAAEFKVSKGVVYNWSYERRLPVLKVGNRIRFTREAVEKFKKKLERKALRQHGA